MNTSSKGSNYERAYKALLYKRGARLVVRAAASKGPFDLLAAFPDTVAGYQCKAGRTSCHAAELLKDTLWGYGDVWPYVVHRTKEREFCEH